MKCHPLSGRKGFTLIELSLAIMMGLAIAAVSMILFNQQLAFLRIYKAQSFLSDEAPLISLHVSKLVGKAERFRLHRTVAEAVVGTNPQSTPSPVLVLNFRQPDGIMRASILSYENRGSGAALYYYLVPLPPGVLAAPQWYVTKAPTNVAFSVATEGSDTANLGILRMTLTGPNGEQITYSGAMTQ